MNERAIINLDFRMLNKNNHEMKSFSLTLTLSEIECYYFKNKDERSIEVKINKDK